MSFDARVLRAPALLLAALALPCCSGDVGEGDVYSRVTLRISETPDGLQANGESTSPSFSSDGMIVAFGSAATNLTDSDGNGFFDVFVRDRRTGAIENITNINFGGINMFGGNSGGPQLSSDGRYIAFSTSGKFESGGQNLNPTPAIFRPYLYDRVTRKFKEVLGQGGVHLDDHAYGFSLSGDGRYLVVATNATNTGYANASGRVQVYYCDFGPNRDQSNLTLLSHASASATQISNGNHNVWPGSISEDGEVVAFESTSTDLLPAQDADAGADMYYWRRSTGALALASVGSSNIPPQKQSFMGSLSRDGTTVGFIHYDATLWPTPDAYTCQLYDIGTGQRRTVSDPGVKVEAMMPVALSGDGHRVIYSATVNGVIQQILFIDGAGNQILAQSTRGDISTEMIQRGSLSNDGRWASWFTPAANMVPHDTNGLMDIFIRGPY